MKKLKYITLGTGTVLLLNALLASILSNMSAGLFMTYFCGAFFVFGGIFADRFKNKIFRTVMSFILLGMVCEAIFVFTVFIYGANDTADYVEDAVIVLGSGVKGEKVPPNLQNRLDAAYEYFLENPDSVIVVSGGQGNGENISEALAMQRYLTGKGIPTEKILMEDRSTSTEENFKFSKELLDSYFNNEEYSVVFVTNDFHIIRAKFWANEAGFESVSHLHSKTPFWIVIPNGIRESMGIVKQMWLHI